MTVVSTLFDRWCALLCAGVLCYAAVAQGEEPGHDDLKPITGEGVRTVKPIPRSQGGFVVPREEGADENVPVDDGEDSPDTPAPEKQPAQPVPAKSGWALPGEEGQAPEQVATVPNPQDITASSEEEQAPALSEALQEANARAKRIKRDDKKRVQKIVKIYEGVARENDRDPEALFRYGLALTMAGDHRQALTQIEKALVLKPESTRYLCDLSTVALRARQYNKALAAGLKAIALRPGVAKHHNIMGNANAAAGRSQQAVDNYRDAIRLAPGKTEYIHNLARVYLRAEKYKTAIEMLDEVIRLDPQSSTAHNDRGSAYQMTGKLEKALEDFRSALHLNPNNPLVHHNLALVYANDSDPQFTFRFRAMEHAKTAVKLTHERNATYLMGLAEAYRANREYEKSVEYAGKAILIDPSDQNKAQMKKYEKLLHHGYTEEFKVIDGR